MRNITILILISSNRFGGSNVLHLKIYHCIISRFIDIVFHAGPASNTLASRRRRAEHTPFPHIPRYTLEIDFKKPRHVYVLGVVRGYNAYILYAYNNVIMRHYHAPQLYMCG